MKHILTAAAMAALLAAPALAQTPSAAAANSYEQQIRAIYAEIDSGALPEKVRADLQLQAMVVKAEAYRHGIVVEVPPRPEATAAR